MNSMAMVYMMVYTWQITDELLHTIHYIIYTRVCLPMMVPSVPS